MKPYIAENTFFDAFSENVVVLAQYSFKNEKNGKFRPPIFNTLKIKILISLRRLFKILVSLKMR
jgi:hypothetical protein